MAFGYLLKQHPFRAHRKLPLPNSHDAGSVGVDSRRAAWLPSPRFFQACLTVPLHANNQNQTEHRK